MHIWVDADACPKTIRKILFRAAERLKIPVSFISNQRLTIPKSDFIETIQVPGGFDIADEYIIKNADRFDIVITADIPLAVSVIDKGALALNPRGTLYDQDNINEILTVRNLKIELKSAGLDIGGPSQFKPEDIQAFANQLDRLLSNL